MFATLHSLQLSSATAPIRGHVVQCMHVCPALTVSSTIWVDHWPLLLKSTDASPRKGVPYGHCKPE